MPARVGTNRPIGLIGIGLMGLAIAARLRKANRKILGFDIAPARRKAFEKLGGIAVQNASDVFQSCGRILISLPELDVVTRLIHEVRSALRPRHIIIDTTTGAPDQAIALARKLARQGVTYLDATVSGNSEQLRRGEVVLLVGGSKSSFDKCRDLFRAIGKQALHTGPVGSGSKMKLVTNLVLGLNRAALAEGLVFAKILGISGAEALTALRSTMAYSRIMDVKGEKMLRRDFKPQARLSQHLKDVRLMLAAAKKSGMELPLSETHRKILEHAEAAGLGQLDNSAIIRVIGKSSVK